MPCLPSASNALRIESVAFAKPFPTKAKSDMAIWIHLATPFGGIWEHQCYLGSHGQKKCKSFKRFQRHDKPSQFCDVSPPPPYSELPWKVNGERNWRNRKLWKTGTKNRAVPSGPDTWLQKVMMRNALRQNRRIIWGEIKKSKLEAILTCTSAEYPPDQAIPQKSLKSQKWSMNPHKFYSIFNDIPYQSYHVFHIHLFSGLRKNGTSDEAEAPGTHSEPTFCHSPPPLSWAFAARERTTRNDCSCFSDSFPRPNSIETSKWRSLKSNYLNIPSKRWN